jgi:two-component system LytT family response regulator
MSIRVLIVDDEAHARARLRHMLAAESDLQIASECSNGRQAIEAIHREQPDLVFLDIQMPRVGGFDVCEALAKPGIPVPLIIFVTAHDEFALKAFEVHAVDYLLKPFDRARLQQALNHARSRLRPGGPHTAPLDLVALLQELKPGLKHSDRLVFKENGRLLFVRTADIDWIEADGNYVRLHAGTNAHHFRETLSGLEAQLPRDRFIRISRSTLVNLDRIKEMQPLFYGDYQVLLHNGSRLNMSRAYRDRLDALISDK